MADISPIKISTTKEKVSRNPFFELSLVYGRDLLRSPGAFLGALLIPFLLFFIFVGIGAILPSAPEYDFTSGMMPVVVVTAVMTTAFFASVTPISSMREIGVFRLFDTTPVPRWAVFIAFLPSRLALAAFQSFAIIGLAVIMTNASVHDWGIITLAIVLGLLFFSALGLAISTVLPGTEITSQVLGLIMMVPLLTGPFIAMPEEFLPDTVLDILNFIPTTYLFDLLLHSMSGHDLIHPLWLSATVLGGSTLLLGLAALFLFRRRGSMVNQ